MCFTAVLIVSTVKKVRYISDVISNIKDINLEKSGVGQALLVF